VLLAHVWGGGWMGWAVSTCEPSAVFSASACKKRLSSSSRCFSASCRARECATEKRVEGVGEGPEFGPE
jgi:hypothetical protein